MSYDHDGLATKRAEQPIRVASTAEIRLHFPALERRSRHHTVAYFDGPGGTQVPQAVVEAITEYLYYHNANTHWAYPSSVETDAALAYARAALADFLGARPTEIAFGANMTTLTFHLSRALGRQYHPGDEIVVTELDHHANVAPWHRLAGERGVTIRTVKMRPETGQLDWDHLQQQITPHTKLLAIGAASNALGTITDVRQAAELAHTVGALVFVDAVHYAPHTLVDVRTIDCDFLACSPYKFYGPHTGVLWVREELLQSLDFPKLLPASDAAPERAETGTQNHEGIVGAHAAVDFLASLADGEVKDNTRRARLQIVFDALHARGTALVTRLWQGLSVVEGVHLYGPPPDLPRTPTVAFTVDNRSSSEVVRHLADKGIFASHGDFYATTVAERLGQSGDGLVRAGCACYTTEEEIERLIEGVSEIAYRA